VGRKPNVRKPNPKRLRPKTKIQRSKLKRPLKTFGRKFYRQSLVQSLVLGNRMDWTNRILCESGPFLYYLFVIDKKNLLPWGPHIGHLPWKPCTFIRGSLVLRRFRLEYLIFYICWLFFLPCRSNNNMGRFPNFMAF
jgi:hypothetical protein